MGVVYYKYKCQKETFSVPVPNSFISVSELKRLILTSDRHGRGRTRGRGPREDISISAQTGEEYADETALIPQNTTVLIHRTVGKLSETIVLFSSHKVIEDGSVASNKSVVTESASRSCSTTDVQGEDAAIAAVIDAAQLKWEEQPYNRMQASGRFTSGHHHGHGPLERETPPPGYVCRSSGVPGHFIQHCSQETPPPGYICHRCRIPGHFIHHCPTNSDSNFDNYKISRSLAPAISGSPMDGIPSTLIPAMSLSVGNDLPAELHCQLCNKVMTDAVLASKCCFDSFCDKCIRDYIIKESKCICGVKVLAHDLIPNHTLRSTISNMLATRANSTTTGTGEKKSSSSSNPDPKSQGHTPSTSLEKEMKSMDHQLAPDALDYSLHVGTEDDIVNHPQEYLSMNDDLKNKEKGNSSVVLKLNDGSKSTSKVTTISGTPEPKVTKTDKPKKKIRKSDSAKISHPNDACYGYSIPVDPAYYNPFNNGYPWLTEPYMYGSLGMPYGGYPMPLQALPNQGYPANYHSWETHPSLHRGAEAAAHSRKAERSKTFGRQSQSSAYNQHLGSPRGRESKNRSDDYDEDHHSEKRMCALSSLDDDVLSRHRSIHGSRSLTHDTQSRQAEKSKDSGALSRSSARNHNLGARGMESRLIPERTGHGHFDRASNDYEDRHSRMRTHVSSLMHGDTQSRQKSRQRSRSLTCDDLSDDERNFKRSW